MFKNYDIQNKPNIGVVPIEKLLRTNKKKYQKTHKNT